MSHPIVFMMTPYDASYANVEHALRLIFERPPYFFEVRLARDYHYKSWLLANIREHLDVASCFVAELSDGNVNVLLEVGAALLKTDGPVICLRSSDAKASVPTDLGGLLWTPYGSRQDSAEKIASDLRDTLERHGETINAQLSALTHGKRRRYLSPVYLANLETIILSSRTAALIAARYRTLEALIEAPVGEIVRVGSLPSESGGRAVADALEEIRRAQ